MAQHQTRNRTTFFTLDGMRGLAALAVVERHKPDFLFGQAWPAGYLAVDLFFILSGFVIAHAYEEHLRNGWRFADFAKARVIRLYPLYLLATLLSTILFTGFFVLEGGEQPWGALATTLGTALFFLPTPDAFSVDGTRLFPLNDPAWSLFFEIAINLVFAAFILKMTLRRMIAIAVIAAAGLVFSIFHFGSADIGFDWNSILGGFPRVTAGFFIGVLLYRLWQCETRPTRFSGWAWPVQIAMMALFIVPVAGAYRPHYDSFVCLVLFPILIHIAARTDPGAVSKRMFAVLGAASYGIYVFHIPFARALKAMVEMTGFEIAAMTPWIGFVYMALLFAGSYVLEMAFDRPLRKRLNRRFVKAPGASVVPEARRQRILGIARLSAPGEIKA